MPTRRRILLVDDSPTIRSILKVYLLDADVEFTEAADGVAALAALEGGGFDAVVADVRMTPIDGLELVQHIRSRERTRNLPVILLTGDLEQGLRRKGLEAGADAFVHKPVSGKLLREALEMAVARRSKDA
ncbi:MAG: response regulator [Myxococcales bacterium]